MKARVQKRSYFSRLIAMLSATLLYLIVWYSLSGQNELWLVFTGAVVSLLAAIYIQPLRLTSRNFVSLLSYTLWLLKEMAKAAYSVAKLTFTLSAPHPVVIQVPTAGLSKLGIIAYSSSITLTPGTITLALNDNMLEVSAIDKATAHDLSSGSMLKRLLNVPMFCNSKEKQ